MAHTITDVQSLTTAKQHVPEAAVVFNAIVAIRAMAHPVCPTVCIARLKEPSAVLVERRRFVPTTHGPAIRNVLVIRYAVAVFVMHVKEEHMCI